MKENYSSMEFVSGLDQVKSHLEDHVLIPHHPGYSRKPAIPCDVQRESLLSTPSYLREEEIINHSNLEFISELDHVKSDPEDPILTTQSCVASGDSQAVQSEVAHVGSSRESAIRAHLQLESCHSFLP